MFPRLAEIPTPWGPLVVQTHGALVAVALVAGWYLFTLGTAAQSPRDRGRLYLAMSLGGLVGGKLVRAASHGGVFFEGGLDALGVLLGGAFVLWLGGPRSRALAPRAASVGAMVAAAIGLGEHFGGARFGRVAESPTWLVVRHPRWPDLLGSPAWRAHLADGRIDEDAVSSLPTIPVGLLEAAVALVLFALARWRPRFGPAIVLGGYALARLGLDRLREHPSTVDLVVAVLVLVLSIVAARPSRAAALASA
ncbi:MAG: prolipoprotein diacylglyceryl transferase [Sandaracinus sp.]|nr:prolipoprotein diacylglyceryl transferase [Myxococcales bacterium]MCB9603281.1 prolipoprotein diacylglyceryl transferase [Sandaracinus sp.]MCB9613231.1 prolipoprotein diacylglyceryl transferase [Sandaracinus sp.]